MPPKIVSDVIIEPGSQKPCSATGTPPIYIALIQNFTVLMNTTNTASSKLYQEGNYTCVATSNYGTDVKHFVIKGGEKIRYCETTPCRALQLGGGGSVMSSSCPRRNCKQWLCNFSSCAVSQAVRRANIPTRQTNQLYIGKVSTPRQRPRIWFASSRSND